MAYYYHLNIEEQTSAHSPETYRSVLSHAADLLKKDAVAILPTDSVYGIGCAAYKDNPALKRTFNIKQRPSTQTLPWLIADPADIARYGKNLPAGVDTLVECFWPGALTLVVEASSEVPAEYCAEDGTIALRCPASDFLRELMRQVGPLALTSANLHGRDVAAAANELDQALLDQVDLVVDAGSASLGVASTIVGLTDGALTLYREGAIPFTELQAALS